MQKKVEVKPNMTIHHEDVNAICTKVGWEAYRKRRSHWMDWLVGKGTFKPPVPVVEPYELIDNRSAPGS
jgi:hypothetical protein